MRYNPAKLMSRRKVGVVFLGDKGPLRTFEMDMKASVIDLKAALSAVFTNLDTTTPPFIISSLSVAVSFGTPKSPSFTPLPSGTVGDRSGKGSSSGSAAAPSVGAVSGASTSGSPSNTAVVGIAVGSVTLFCLILVCSAFIFNKRRRRRRHYLHNTPQIESALVSRWWNWPRRSLEAVTGTPPTAIQVLPLTNLDSSALGVPTAEARGASNPASPIASLMTSIARPLKGHRVTRSLPALELHPISPIQLTHAPQRSLGRHPEVEFLQDLRRHAKAVEHAHAPQEQPVRKVGRGHRVSHSLPGVPLHDASVSSRKGIGGAMGLARAANGESWRGGLAQAVATKETEANIIDKAEDKRCSQEGSQWPGNWVASEPPSKLSTVSNSVRSSVSKDTVLALWLRYDNALLGENYEASTTDW